VAIQTKGSKGGDVNLEFDNTINKIMRRLEEIEKKWVLGEYDFVRLDLYYPYRMMLQWIPTQLSLRTCRRLWSL
jgi:hypothetical protein